MGLGKKQEYQIAMRRYNHWEDGTLIHLSLLAKPSSQQGHIDSESRVCFWVSTRRARNTWISYV